MTTQRSTLGYAGLILAAALLFFGGCTLYFGPDDDGPPSCDDPRYCGGTPGYQCDSDRECAAGCYCTDAEPEDGQWGTCVESGYCGSASDCGPGMTCDDGTCKPTNRGCMSDYDCPSGTVCDPAGQYCVPTQACDGGCPMGTRCDETRNTCVPVGCTDDSQCAAGCYCDEQTGTCAETSYCTADDQCPAGQYCDENRSTCMPGTDPNAPSCGGAVTCDAAPPTCPAGQVPLIANGCYTGACRAIDQCDTPPVCEVINDEAHCLGRMDCTALYTGINCRDPQGNACTSGSANCTCERFQFAHCAADAPPVP